MTSTSASYLAQLKVPSDSNYTTHGDSNNESDDGNDPYHGIDELDLKLGLYSNLYNDLGASKYELWVAGIKCDPLRRTWKLIHILCALDKQRQGLQNYIEDENTHGWFSKKDKLGNHKKIEVPKLQLLQDMKMRWDSVYMMLQRLRCLQPVSQSQ